MQYLTQLVLTVPLILAAPAGARVYQCTNDAGVVTFQDVRCDAGATAVLRQPFAGASPGLRPAEKQWLRELGKRPAKHAAKGRRAKATGGAERARQEQRCWKKQQLLDEVRARLRRGYKAAQGDKLRRRRRAYEHYLSRYCD